MKLKAGLQEFLEVRVFPEEGWNAIESHRLVVAHDQPNSDTCSAGILG